MILQIELNKSGRRGGSLWLVARYSQVPCGAYEQRESRNERREN